MKKDKILYVSYNIDTEGPLTESIKASFQRIKESFGINLQPSKKNLEKIRNGKIKYKSNFLKKKLEDFVNSNRVTTLGSWEKIFNQIKILNTKNFNKSYIDSFGKPLVFTWFILTHAGFTGSNPRKRDLGYNKVFKKYNFYLKKVFKNNLKNRNEFGWHFHAHSITNDAHRASTTYLNSSHIYDVLSHYVLDVLWFPIIFRAGHNSLRQDLNYFLEEWIPFDFSNTSYKKKKKLDNISSSARFGNWARASQDWVPYNPDFYDYQKKGIMKRYVFRTLPINEREYKININDVYKGFKDANTYGKAMISVTNHDFRDIFSDINYFYKLILKAKKKYPNIKFKFVSAKAGAKKILNIENNTNKRIGLKAKLVKKGNQHRLFVKVKHNVFGTQPFLAIKTKENKYFWQNFDHESKLCWSYSFDPYNILLDKVKEIGIAASNKYGNTELIKIDITNNKITKKTIN